MQVTVGPVSDGHYFDDDPSIGSAPASVEIVLPDVSVALTADRGVFAADHLDAGTKLLLLEAPPLEGAPTVLDLGCGWGPIACVAASRNANACVWAVDVNARARALTAANAIAAGVEDRVCVTLPDDVPDDVRFDRILSNPPIRIGKPALHDMLRRWLRRLEPTGVAHLVVQKNLGSDSLARQLEGEGFPTRRLSSRAGSASWKCCPRRGGTADDAPRRHSLTPRIACGWQTAEGEQPMTHLDDTARKRLHREWRRRTDGRLALILDGVQNPLNVGGVIRTAAAERVDHLWIASGTAPNHARVNKTALGSARYLAWTETDDGPGAVAAARNDGYRVVAIELTTDAVPLPDADIGGEVALVIGNENRGVAPATLAVCDQTAFIPQLGRVGSLNVAAAAAIAIYEVRRRSWSRR